MSRDEKADTSTSASRAPVGDAGARSGLELQLKGLDYASGASALAPVQRKEAPTGKPPSVGGPETIAPAGGEKKGGRQPPAGGEKDASQNAATEGGGEKASGDGQAGGEKKAGGQLVYAAPEAKDAGTVFQRVAAFVGAQLVPEGTKLSLKATGQVNPWCVYAGLDFGLDIERHSHGWKIGGSVGFHGGLRVAADDLLEIKAGVFGNFGITASADSIGEAFSLAALGVEHSMRERAKTRKKAGKKVLNGIWTGGEEDYLARIEKAKAKMDALPEIDEARMHSDPEYAAKMEELLKDADIVEIVSEFGLETSFKLGLPFKLFGNELKVGFGGQRLLAGSKTTISSTEGEEGLTSETKKIDEAFSFEVTVGPVTLAFSETIIAGESELEAVLEVPMPLGVWPTAGLATVITALDKLVEVRKGKTKTGRAIADIALAFPRAALQAKLGGVLGAVDALAGGEKKPSGERKPAGEKKPGDDHAHRHHEVLLEFVIGGSPGHYHLHVELVNHEAGEASAGVVKGGYEAILKTLLFDTTFGSGAGGDKKGGETKAETKGAKAAH